jgi:NAD(P)-dependent dehydrogenase (short-subunit alcohol dehydrogenase family)
MAGQLKGRVVIVTGAGGGMGRAFAQALAAEGASLVCADRNADGAKETAKRIGRRAISMGMDVTQEADTEALAARTVEKFGRIDVLVNNAAIYGGLTRAPFWEQRVDEWDRVQAVNVKGVWLCSKAVFHQMRTQGGGKIINIASATVFSGSPRWCHYVSSKAAVIGLTRTIAKEAGEFGITANAIAPGFTLTDASKDMVANAVTYGVERGAIRRNAEAGDMLGTAVFLASPASDFITGQTIIVDGGRQFI